jgi:hypothetical protein
MVFILCTYVQNNFKNIFKSMTWNVPKPVISESRIGGLALSHV